MITFSVIVPTYNRPGQLPACLKALASVAFERDDYEVIVVDDGTPQPLDAVVQPFCNQMQLSLLRQGNSGPAAARNLGCSQAQGRYLAFTDDDCAPEPEWLSALLDAHTKHPQALLGGQTLNGLPGNIFATANQLVSDAVTSWWRDHASPLSFFPSNNLSAPAELFRELGGFSTTIPLVAAEDRQLCSAWLDRGWPLISVPEARVFHLHSQNLRRFLSMHFRYGRGARLFHLHWPPDRELPLEGWPFYSNLLGYPFREQRGSRALLLSSLIFLSQASVASGYFYQRTIATRK